MHTRLLRVRQSKAPTAEVLGMVISYHVMFVDNIIFTEIGACAALCAVCLDVLCAALCCVLRCAVLCAALCCVLRCAVLCATLCCVLRCAVLVVYYHHSL